MKIVICFYSFHFVHNYFYVLHLMVFLLCCINLMHDDIDRIEYIDIEIQEMTANCWSGIKLMLFLLFVFKAIKFRGR